MARESDEEISESEEGSDRTPLTMTVPAALLVAGGIALGCWPGLGSALQQAAVHLEDQHGYALNVFTSATRIHWQGIAAPESTDPTLGSVLTSLATAAGAVAVALLSLYRKRLPLLAGYHQAALVRRIADTLQSGIVNDYVAWLVLGVACFGGALAFAVR